MIRLAALAAVAALAGSEGPPDYQLFGDSTQVQIFPVLHARIASLKNSARGETRSGMLVDGTDQINQPWPGSVVGATVLINHGMNDARPWAKVPIAVYKANLRTLAKAPARVIFQTPNPSLAPGRDTAPYAQAMREVAAETGRALIDVHACFQRQPDWRERLYDGVHPDDRAVRYIVGACIVPALREMRLL